MCARVQCSYCACVCSPREKWEAIAFTLHSHAGGREEQLSEYLLTVGNVSRVFRGAKSYFRIERSWSDDVKSSPLCAAQPAAAAGGRSVSRSKRYMRRYLEAETKSPLTLEHFSDGRHASGGAQGFTLTASNIILTVNREARQGFHARRPEDVERALRVALRQPPVAGSLEVRRAGEWRQLRAIGPRINGAPIY